MKKQNQKQYVALMQQRGIKEYGIQTLIPLRFIKVT